METIKHFVEAIVEFNQQILGIDQRDVGPLSDDEFDITTKALFEEASEFADARIHVDAIDWSTASDMQIAEAVAESVDALVDLIYFAVGGLYKHGLTAHDIINCMDIVHQANMTKKKGVVAKRASGDAADAVKPQDWVDPKHSIRDILIRRMA